MASTRTGPSSAYASGNSVSHAHIVSLLARSLGDDKARAVWSEALQQLRVVPASAYTAVETRTLLESLSQTGGIVGVAARFASVRLGQSDAALGLRSSSSDRMQAVRAPANGALGGASRPSPRGPVATDEVYGYLLELFAPALGEDKARDVLAQHAGLLGLDPRALTFDQGLQLLETLAKVAGLLGVVANFAKVKFLLRYPG